MLAQARMMKNMDKNALRSMNPQFAGMSDADIDTAASQMEMLARPVSNPRRPPAPLTASLKQREDAAGARAASARIFLILRGGDGGGGGGLYQSNFSCRKQMWWSRPKFLSVSATRPDPPQ